MTSPCSKSYHSRSGMTSIYSTRSEAYLMTDGTTGLLSSPTSGFLPDIGHQWACPRSTCTACWYTLSISTLIVPDKHVQPVCLKMIFFTIDSLINVVSSACVILVGSCTFRTVGVWSLFNCKVATRFCPAAVVMFSSFSVTPHLIKIIRDIHLIPAMKKVYASSTVGASHF